MTEREPLGRAETLEILAGLLAADDAESLEAFHSDRLAERGISLADAATARLLLLEIVRTLEQGDPESCDRLALALDATVRSDPQPRHAATPAPSVDVTMPAAIAVVPSVDATLEVVAPALPRPTVQIAMPASEPTPAAGIGPAGDDDPLSVSVDDTVMVGHLEALHLEGGAAAEVAAFAEHSAVPHDPRAREPGPIEPASGVHGSQAERTGSDAGAALGPLLDLDRYAVLCAWSQLQPDRLPLFNRQYGLESEQERAELDGSFEALFADDAEARRAFDRRLAVHLAWLKKS